MYHATSFANVPSIRQKGLQGNRDETHMSLLDASTHSSEMQSYNEDGVAYAAYDFKLDKLDCIVIINTMIAYEHWVRMVQTESHAVLSKDPVPPEAICGHKRRGRNEDWSDATVCWYENHPDYFPHQDSPMEPQRIVRIPNAKGEASATRRISDAKAKQRAVDDALMPAPT